MSVLAENIFKEGEKCLEFKKIFVRNKKVKFPKPEKTNIQVKPKRISQRAANYLLLGFVFGMVGLSVLTIVSNAFRSTRSEKPIVQVSDHDSRNLSNRVGLFMTDFLNSYFSDNSPENESRLKDFYGNGLDIKNAQVANLESKLTGAVLIEITDHLATYRVGYAVKVDDEWKNNVGVINIPYSVKDNKFYVSDLPYFTDEESYIAKNVKNKVRLGLQTDTSKYKKAKEYVEAFFKAYVSGDETQMSPFSKEITPVTGYVFDSIDYSYFIEDGEGTLVTIAQVSFSDGLNLKHQENFTVFLQVDQKNETYRIKKMEHGISQKYQSELN